VRKLLLLGVVFAGLAAIAVPIVRMLDERFPPIVPEPLPSRRENAVALTG
jgi:hypothetical protein